MYTIRLQQQVNTVSSVSELYWEGDRSWTEECVAREVHPANSLLLHYWICKLCTYWATILGKYFTDFDAVFSLCSEMMCAHNVKRKIQISKFFMFYNEIRCKIVCIYIFSYKSNMWSRMQNSFSSFVCIYV